MMALSDAFALAGVAIAVCAATVRVCGVGVKGGSTPPGWFTGWRKAWVVTFFIVLLVPIPGTNIAFAGYLRGIFGDLSITLLALTAWSLCHRLIGVAPMAKRENTALLAAVAAATVLMYPTALGWGNWDAYRLGWGSWWFLSGLLAVSAGAAWLGLRVLPAMVALALLAWSAGLMESGNLWDYLLDPWLSAFGVGYVLLKCWQFVFRRSTMRSSF